MEHMQQQARILLQEEADKLMRLIEVQKTQQTMPKCPLYEEVLDTQMFGLSRVVDALVRLELISKEEGSTVMEDLERHVSANIGAEA